MAETYDVIIVGAGTSGCVLAEALTRSGKVNVLLLEAGGTPRNLFVFMPAGFPRLFKGKNDWAYEAEPMAHLGGRRVFVPRGKMLGGSSNINAQMHQWCHPADFDGWVEDGAFGWSWPEVAPVFRSLERWGVEDGDAARGRDGLMLVEPNRAARELSHRFVAAARRAGLGEMPGYNGHAFQGAWIAELAHHAGRRFSAYDACLKPAMRRAQLRVETGVQVSRVVVSQGRATGVAIRQGQQERIIHAGAVVLAAGAYGSPQVLMHSGIGPADQLRAFGIEVREDRAEVGSNLQDHAIFGAVFGTSSRDTFKAAESPLELMRWLLFKRGMLASSAVEAFAFTQLQAGPVRAPDLELLFMPLEVTTDLLKPPPRHAFTIGSAVIKPRSRGRVFLKSADPLAAPGIDLNLLSDSDGADARLICNGIRLARKLAATEPLAQLNTGELKPGPQAESDRDLLDYAGHEIQTVYHPTSTCRMGSDAQAVVDPQLRVRGVEGLWIADASVMPTVPRGHPNAVVAMIGARAAHWIEHALRRA